LFTTVAAIPHFIPVLTATEQTSRMVHSPAPASPPL
jgi:hypothetical protein